MRRQGSHLVGTAHTTTRLEGLTDGVFAIVMTLMVFEIRMPEGTGQPLPSALAELWPQFFAYAVSFVQLGIYWAGHRSQFGFIDREDHVLRWICLLFLGLVSLIPFSTQMLGTHLNDPLAQGIYAANLVAVGLALLWQWAYATGGGRLVGEGLAEGVVSTGVRRTVTAPALYTLAVLLTFVSPVLTLAVFAAVPLFYLFPWLIDRLWVVPR